MEEETKLIDNINQETSPGIKFPINNIAKIKRLLKQFEIIDRSLISQKEQINNTNFMIIPLKKYILSNDNLLSKIKATLEESEQFIIEYKFIKKFDQKEDFSKYPQEIDNYYNKRKNLLGEVLLIYPKLLAKDETPANIPSQDAYQKLLNYYNSLPSTKPKLQSIYKKASQITGEERTCDFEYIYGKKCDRTTINENGVNIIVSLNGHFFNTNMAFERKRVCSKIMENYRGNMFDCMVYFGGIGAFAMQIAQFKEIQNVVVCELNELAVELCEINVNKNQLENKIQIIKGNVQELAMKNCEKWINDFNFQAIVAWCPHNGIEYWDECICIAKYGTNIFYYIMGKIEDAEQAVKEAEKSGIKFGKKIILKEIKKAGEIGKAKWRICIQIQIQ